MPIIEAWTIDECKADFKRMLTWQYLGPVLASLNGHLCILTISPWYDYGYMQRAVWMGKKLLYADGVLYGQSFLDLNYFLDQVFEARYR